MPAVGIVGSVVGGILGSGASRKAGDVINNAGQGAANLITNAGNAASKGLGDSVAGAQKGLSDTTSISQGWLANAAAGAKGQVNAGVTGANQTLSDIFNQESGNLNPYLQTGQQGAQSLSGILANPFKAPSAQDLENTPGYQFQLQQGMQGLQQTAAAHGALQSGGTLKALTSFGQGLAGTRYDTAFNQALSAYNTNASTALSAANMGLGASSLYQGAAQNYGNQAANNTLGGAYFGANTDLNTTAAQVNIGQANALQSGNWGIGGAQTSGNWQLGAAGQAGSDIMAGAQGKAAGIMGSANSWNQAIGGVANGLSGFAGNYFSPSGPGSPGGNFAQSMFGTQQANPYFGGGYGPSSSTSAYSGYNSNPWPSAYYPQGMQGAGFGMPPNTGNAAGTVQFPYYTPPAGGYNAPNFGRAQAL